MIPATVSIRRLQADDAAVLKAFRLAALADAEDAFHDSVENADLPLDSFVRFIASECVFMAMDADGIPCGMAVLAVTARNKAKTRHKAEIWSVYVAGRARRLGIGRRLVEACIAEARSQGFAAVMLTVTLRNTGAAAMYDDLGFVGYGIERNAMKLADGTLLDEKLMQLDL
jgi:ribosomal protein S18 acetylase RimI-like enzyme